MIIEILNESNISIKRFYQTGSNSYQVDMN